MKDLNQVGRHYPPVDEWHRIESALPFIDPQDRETWVAVGQAVQNELGEDGFSLWNEWSQGADNYNERAALDVWRSFGQGGGRTVATLFKRARGNGWTDDTKPAPLTQEEAEASRRSREEAKRRNQEEEARNLARAKAWVEAIIEAAISPPENPYLKYKGFSSNYGLKSIHIDDLRRIIGYTPSVNDSPLTGVVLVVPCFRDFGPDPVNGHPNRATDGHPNGASRGE